MGEKKVVYIAGPITSVKEYWKPFEQAADEILAMGYTPLTPTCLPYDISNEKAMRICLSMIDQADAVYFLPGWNLSVGANLEMYYCKYTNKPHTTKLSLLAEMKGLF